MGEESSPRRIFLSEIKHFIAVAIVNVVAALQVAMEGGVHAIHTQSFVSLLRDGFLAVKRVFLGGQGDTHRLFYNMFFTLI